MKFVDEKLMSVTESEAFYMAIQCIAKAAMALEDVLNNGADTMDEARASLLEARYLLDRILELTSKNPTN
jgi:hypothetical protein